MNPRSFGFSWQSNFFFIVNLEYFSFQQVVFIFSLMYFWKRELFGYLEFYLFQKFIGCLFHIIILEALQALTQQIDAFSVEVSYSILGLRNDCFFQVIQVLVVLFLNLVLLITVLKIHFLFEIEMVDKEKMAD